jgi:hypothetical protein
VPTSDEILLTAQEINQIEQFVLQNPQLADPNCFNVGNGHCGVVKVSPVTGLIIVKGNSFTGFDHIHSRHEFFSFVPYWTDVVQEDGSTKKQLQDQSRFRPDSVPFWDYISIADSIYKPENINVEKNTRVLDFDLYFGQHVHKDGVQELYKMLVYKNSKVIHTLYPQSNKNNQKRVSKFNFARGVVKGMQNYNENFVEITIPYLDAEHYIKYSILIRKYLGKKTEEAFVLIHNKNGEPESFVSVAERKFNDCPALGFEVMVWQQADLRGLESYIKTIHRQICGKQ